MRLTIPFQSCGWERTSTYKGIAGTRYQSISDFTQPTQPMNVGDTYVTTDHLTGNSVLLAKGESDTHKRNHLNPSLPEMWLNYSR